jgi:hypothetical protein
MFACPHCADLLAALRLAIDCLSVADPEREHPHVERAIAAGRKAIKEAALASIEPRP